MKNISLFRYEPVSQFAIGIFAVFQAARIKSSPSTKPRAEKCARMACPTPRRAMKLNRSHDSGWVISGMRMKLTWRLGRFFTSVNPKISTPSFCSRAALLRPMRLLPQNFWSLFVTQFCSIQKSRQNFYDHIVIQYHYKYFTFVILLYYLCIVFVIL
jgi:hypothetical protein